MTGLRGWLNGVITPGVHRMQPYAGLGNPEPVLPNTEKVVSRTLLLPTGSAIQLDQVRQICQIVRLAWATGVEISRRLGRG